jgi:hypothetical protein
MEVGITSFTTISAGSTVNELFSIPSGSTLTISNFGVSCSPTTSAGKYARIELQEDINGDLSSLVLIKLVFCQNLNYETGISAVFIGNGTKKILLRTVQVGNEDMSIFRFWDGYRTN